MQSFVTSVCYIYIYVLFVLSVVTNLKQNEAQSARADLIGKGVN